MFADPITVTYPTAGEKTFNKISSGLTESIFTDSSDSRKMRISHQRTKNRSRHMVRLDETIIAADPISGLNKQLSYSAYIVIDEPIGSSISDAELTDQVLALTGFLEASSAANTVKVLQSQT